MSTSPLYSMSSSNLPDGELLSTEVNFDRMLEALDYGLVTHALKKTKRMSEERLASHESSRQEILDAIGKWNVPSGYAGPDLAHKIPSRCDCEQSSWVEKRAAVELGTYNPTEEDLPLLRTTQTYCLKYTAGRAANESEEDCSLRRVNIQQTSDYMRFSIERLQPRTKPPNAGAAALRLAAQDAMQQAKDRRGDTAYELSTTSATLTSADLAAEQQWDRDAVRLGTTMAWWRTNGSSIETGTFVPQWEDRGSIEQALFIFPQRIQKLQDEHTAETASEGKGKGKEVPKNSLELSGDARAEKSELEGFIKKLESYLTTIHTVTSDTAVPVEIGGEGQGPSNDLEHYLTSLASDTAETAVGGEDTASLKFYLKKHAGKISNGSLREDILTGERQPGDHRDFLVHLRSAIDTRLALALSTEDDEQDGNQQFAISAEAADHINELISVCKMMSAHDLEHESFYGQKRATRDSSGDDTPTATTTDAGVGRSGAPHGSKRGRRG